MCETTTESEDRLPFMSFNHEQETGSTLVDKNISGSVYKSDLSTMNGFKFVFYGKNVHFEVGRIPVDPRGASNPATPRPLPSSYLWKLLTRSAIWETSS